MNITLFDLAQRFVGMREIAGEKDNGFIVWAHSLCAIADAKDELPWCSSWLNACAWMLRLPRSKSAGARTWLEVGIPIELDEAMPGFDVVILRRGKEPQPGPEVIKAQGHVGLFAGIMGDSVLVLGGNQSDSVSIAPFDISRVLGVRRLA